MSVRQPLSVYGFYNTTPHTSLGFLSAQTFRSTTMVSSTLNSPLEVSKTANRMQKMYIPAGEAWCYTGLEDYSAYQQLLDEHLEGDLTPTPQENDFQSPASLTSTLFDAIESLNSEDYSACESDDSAIFSITNSHAHTKVPSPTRKMRKSPKVTDLRIGSPVEPSMLEAYIHTHHNTEISEKFRASLLTAGSSFLVGVKDDLNVESARFSDTGRVYCQGVLYDFEISSEELFA